MSEGRPDQRTPRVDRGLWWRMPVFGILSSVLAVEFSVELAFSGSALARRVASAPGHLYWLLTLGPQRMAAHQLYRHEAWAISTVNQAAWALLGLALGVLLAVILRPRPKS